MENVQLCDSKGFLNINAVGWSRHPVHSCNLGGHWLRKKKWNYWLITTGKYLFSITLATMDYAGLAFGYFYNRETGDFIEKTITVPLGKGIDMPDGTRKSISFRHKNMKVSFLEEREFTKIYVECPDFGQTSLSAEFVVEHTQNHETMNVVIPWNKKAFQYTSKQNCLPVVGTVTLSDETFYFRSGESFASLDYGRGIWPRKSFWNWATCSGRTGDRIIGLNLGGSWTDGTGMTENAILVDGRISKLGERVIFDYDRNDIMKPWVIRSENSKRVDVTFTPFFERIAKTNYILITSEIHQMFGYFSGKIITDDGESISMDRIMGCAEEHDAKW